MNRRNQEEHFILNARSNQKPVQNISHEGGDMMLARKTGNESTVTWRQDKRIMILTQMIHSGTDLRNFGCDLEVKFVHNDYTNHNTNP